MTRDDIIRMAREAGFRTGHIEMHNAWGDDTTTHKRRQTRDRIDADAVAYHNGAWTSKPLSSRSPSLE